MFVNAGILAAGIATRTYAEFLDHAATIAPTSRTGSATVPPTPEQIRWTVNNGTFQMVGSSFRSVFLRYSDGSAPGSNLRAVTLHALPSESTFINQANAGLVVVLRLEDAGGTGPFVGLDRNGYASFDDRGGGAGVAATRLTRILYWDGEQVMQMNPYAGTGPSPYTW